MKKIITLGGIMGFAPLLASAADIDSILTTLVSYLRFFIPALITIAVIYFIWGVVQFMTSADEEQKKLGRSKIINGLIGLFVIVAFWGLIQVLQTSFGIGNTLDNPINPQVPFTTTP
jgi:hypothetical protein